MIVYDLMAERLRKALRPFAEYATQVDSSAHDDNPIDDACPPVGGYGEGRQINARPDPRSLPQGQGGAW